MFQSVKKSVQKNQKMSSIIIPTLCYKKAPEAIEFLCKAFGFTKHVVHQEEDGTIPHAQLKFGNAMIMVSSEKNNEFGKLVCTPISNNDMNTMSPYIILEDKDMEAHYLNSKTAGAEIVSELKTEEYGGQVYSCKDPEGYLWNFGSYDPWKEQ